MRISIGGSVSRPWWPVGVALSVAVVVCGLALGVGPAGAASKASPKSSTASSGSSGSNSYSAFEKCLAQHGVKSSSGGSFPHGSFPAGSFPAGSFPHGSFPAGSFPHGSFPAGSFPHGSFPVGNSKNAKAIAACRSKLPSGGSFPATGGTLSPAQQQALTAYETCMDSHGVQIASNDTYAEILSLLRSDPAAAAASKSCQGSLGGLFGSPSSSSGKNGKSSSSDPSKSSSSKSKSS